MCALSAVEAMESSCDEWLVFEVTDTGCGISKQGLASLFTEYVQVRPVKLHASICFVASSLAVECHMMLLVTLRLEMPLQNVELCTVKCTALQAFMLCWTAQFGWAVPCCAALGCAVLCSAVVCCAVPWLLSSVACQPGNRR